MADFDKQLDTSGLTCPMPIMKTKKALKTMSDGEVLHVTITDAGSAEDLPGLLEELGNTLLSSSEGDGKFEFTNLNQADALAAVLAQSCPNPDKIIMGISELLINAIEHGNLAITYEEKSELTMKGDWKSEVSKRLADEKYSSRIAKVDLVRDKEKISITIEDEGAGFNWQKYMEFDPARAFDAHGRGIATANQICFDSLEYKGRGNIVIVTVNLS